MPRIFPEIFEEFSCFVSWEAETRKNSAKIPAIFQCKIPRQSRRKNPQKYPGEQAKQQFVNVGTQVPEQIRTAEGKRGDFRGNVRDSLGSTSMWIPPSRLLNKLTYKSCNGRALDRVTKQKHRPNRQKMSKIRKLCFHPLRTIFGHLSDISTFFRHFVDIPCFWAVQRFARYNTRAKVHVELLSEPRLIGGEERTQ